MVGKPLARAAAPRRAFALPAPGRRRQASGPEFPSQAWPFPRPARRGNYGGSSRPQARGKALGERLEVSPNRCG